MINNLVKRTPLFVALVIDVISDNPEKVGRVVLVHYHLLTQKQSTCTGKESDFPIFIWAFYLFKICLFVFVACTHACLRSISPGQTIPTCQRNLLQHCWTQHVACVWPPCCEVLRYVGSCWLKFENGQIWANNTQHVATCRNMVAKHTQHVASNNVAICCDDMLQSFGRGFNTATFFSNIVTVY